MKLSATAKEAVADAQVEMSQEEGTEALPQLETALVAGVTWFPL